MEGKTVYNPEKMTVKQLKVVLKDLKLCVVAKRTLKRKTSNKNFRTGYMAFNFMGIKTTSKQFFPVSAFSHENANAIVCLLVTITKKFVSVIDGLDLVLTFVIITRL